MLKVGFMKRLKVLLVILILLPIFSCSLFKSKKNSPKPLKSIPDNSLILFTALDRTSYKPYEAVIATVELKNLTSKAIRIPSLDIKSLSFYKLQKNSESVVQVFPIVSPKENLLNFEDLKQYDWRRRQFVFTDCSDTSGDYSLYAIYSSGASEAIEGRPNFSSAPFDFTVTGDASFRRDKKGILLKEDAVKIAANKLGEPYTNARADLIINEVGFYDWWITFSLSKNGKEVKKAYLVNPYLCVVRKEVQPYVPSKDDKADEKALEQLRERALKERDKTN